MRGPHFGSPSSQSLCKAALGIGIVGAVGGTLKPNPPKKQTKKNKTKTLAVWLAVMVEVGVLRRLGLSNFQTFAVRGLRALGRPLTSLGRRPENGVRPVEVNPEYLRPCKP